MKLRLSWTRLRVSLLQALVLLLVLFALLQTASSGPLKIEAQGCERAVALKQRQNFYEGLVVLAEGNLENFFLSKSRSELHDQILKKEDRPSSVQLAVWLIPETFQILPASVSYPLGLAEISYQELETLNRYHSESLTMLTEGQLEEYFNLERSVHRKLFDAHQDHLYEYREWAFYAFPPMQAYQRILENYMSSSVWWNHYVIDYSTTLASLLKEMAKRVGCSSPDDTLWVGFSETQDGA